MLGQESAFQRSTYLFCCSYFEWLSSDRFSWCSPLTYLPSSLHISSSTITAQYNQGQRRGRAAVCLSLAPRPAGGEESVAFYICHHSGPPEVLTVVACIVQRQNRFLDCLLFLEICLSACVCVPAVGKLWCRRLACCAGPLFLKYSLSPIQDPFFLLVRLSFCALFLLKSAIRGENSYYQLHFMWILSQLCLEVFAL